MNEGDIAAAGPGAGDPAPDFALRDQHGRRIALSSYAGASAVVVVFFPFAFTSVCSGELRMLREHRDRLADGGAALLAISCDPMFSLRVLDDQEGLGFPLLSDFWPHGAVASAYGVFDGVRGCARRSTFVVDRDGTVRWSVHNDMGEARDVEEYAAVLEGLSATGTDRR